MFSEFCGQICFARETVTDGYPALDSLDDSAAQHGGQYGNGMPQMYLQQNQLLFGQPQGPGMPRMGSLQLTPQQMQQMQQVCFCARVRTVTLSSLACALIVPRSAATATAGLGAQGSQERRRRSAAQAHLAQPYAVFLHLPCLTPTPASFVFSVEERIRRQDVKNALNRLKDTLSFSEVSVLIFP